MKIAVVGCGAVGSYYGAKLAQTGQTVHFLLRSDYEAVRRNGLYVRSPKGDFTVRPRCAKSPQEIGPCDLVMIGLKTTANDQFDHLLPPLLGPHTAVLTLQNGLGNEERLARLLPSEQILGGLCFVCLNRLEPGLVHHIDHGLVILGEFQRWPEPRTHEFAALFRQAGVPCQVTDNLARAHWEKLAWNIPFNGLGVASAAGFEAVVSGRLPAAVAAGDSELRPPAERDHKVKPAVDPASHPLGECLTTDQLLADACWSQLLRELMLEVIGAAQALGFNLAETLADKQIARTRTMGPYRASTLIDFQRRQPLELESLFLEPLRRAQRAGAVVPRLHALCQLLQQLDPAGSS